MPWGCGWAADACWVADGGEWGFGEISFSDVSAFCLGVLSMWIFLGISVQMGIWVSPW